MSRLQIAMQPLAAARLGVHLTLLLLALMHRRCWARRLSAVDVDPGGAAADARRRFLVLAPVGDVTHSQHANTWLDNKSARNWDFIAFYYGKDTNFTCPECLATVRTRGAKWRLVWEFSQTDLYKALAGKYEAVMIPDDDLLMSTHVVNTVFTLVAQYGLVLAQPSVCRHANSFTWITSSYQQPGNLLRFTAMVEIMAPVFDMRTFQHVILPTLEDAYTAWGLDLVWPVLLGFPRDKIAVIDGVCMTHPAVQPEKVSLYKEADNPYGGSATAEMQHQLRKYRVTNATMAENGLPEHLGSAPPFGVIPMPPNGLLALDPPSPAAEPAPWQTLHSRLGSPLWVSAPCMAFLVLFLAAYLGWPTTVPELKRKSSEASLLVRSPARPLSLAAVTAPRLLFRQNSSGKCSNQGQDAGGDG